MKRIKRNLGRILVDAGLITNDQLEQATSNGQPLTGTLVELGFITETQIASALSKEMDVPYVDLANYDINQHAATSVAEDIALRYLILPIDYEDKKLVIAMFDPSNVAAIDDVKIVSGSEVKVVIATETDILNAISEVFKIDQQVEDVVDSVGDDEVDETIVEDEEVSDKSSPVVKMVDSLLVESVRKRANDIHIEPQENGVRVRYRIDGVLHNITNAPKKMQASFISRIKIMAGLDIAEKRVPQDGRFGLKVDRKHVDFRVATLPTVYGEKLVLRLLEKENIMINLNKLGLEKESLKFLKGSLKRPYGAILITGPTGSGKTTTLYAALSTLNEIGKNIITVEDPVEYKLDIVNQVQVNPRAGLTFAAGLRSILRHDPDIVMIGEIRDKETAKVAIESALTGHLVLSTLHTNDAPSTLTRLIEMKVEPFLISSAVDCIVAQRLARKLCKHCTKSYKPSEKLLKEIGLKNQNLNEVKFYKPVGCKKCSKTGYRGRIGLYEVMLMDSAIKELTVNRANGDEIKRAAIINGGMRTLREDGLSKVLAGVTSIEEVIRVTV